MENETTIYLTRQMNIIPQLLKSIFSPSITDNKSQNREGEKFAFTSVIFAFIKIEAMEGLKFDFQSG